MHLYVFFNSPIISLVRAARDIIFSGQLVHSDKSEAPFLFVAMGYSQTHQRVRDLQYIFRKGCINIDIAGLRPLQNAVYGICYK